MTTQPEALRLAAELEACPTINYKTHAAELRRLHEENERLRIVAEMTTLLLDQRDALLEALQDLYDEQEGPPLIRRHRQWQAAIDKARAAIAKVESGNDKD